MLGHVERLAGEIGPRGTGTPGEAAAADYVAGLLAGLGLPVERQEFRAVTSQNAFAVAVDLTALLAVVLYPLGGPARWLAVGLGLAAPALLWQAIRTSHNLQSFLLPKVTSRSVIGRIVPSGETRKRAVILAHLDTNRCRLAWQSSMTRWLEPLTWLTLGMLAMIGLLYLVGALLAEFYPGRIALQSSPIFLSGRTALRFDPFWWFSLIPAAYVVGTLVTLWRDERTLFSPGAHDNAASVAVGLEIAGRLAVSPLHETETWLGFTGAEETDHAGLYALLKAYPEQMRQAAFIGLEGVGGGEIVYLERQGLCAHYTPHPGLLSLARRTALEHPDLEIKPGVMTMEDEVGTLRRKGYCAIGIAGRDPLSGSLPYWHRPDDTPDKISPQALDRAADFVMAFLKAIDGEEAICKKQAG